MQAFPQGLVKTATAGNRVQFPALNNNTNGLVCRIMISQATGTQGAVTVGGSNVVHSTKVGAARQFLAPGASAFLDSEELIEDDANTIDPTQFWVDSQNNNEGVIVCYYQI